MEDKVISEDTYKLEVADSSEHPVATDSRNALPASAPSDDTRASDSDSGIVRSGFAHTRWVIRGESDKWPASGCAARAAQAADRMFAKDEWSRPVAIITSTGAEGEEETETYTPNDPAIPAHTVADNLSEGDAYRVGFEGDELYERTGCGMVCYSFQLAALPFKRDKNTGRILFPERITIQGRSDAFLADWQKTGLSGAYVVACYSSDEKPPNWSVLSALRKNPNDFDEEPHRVNCTSASDCNKAEHACHRCSDNSHFDDPETPKEDRKPSGSDPVYCGDFDWNGVTHEPDDGGLGYSVSCPYFAFTPPKEGTITLATSYSAEFTVWPAVMPLNDESPVYLHVALAISNYYGYHGIWSEGGACLDPTTLKVYGGDYAAPKRKVNLFWENEQMLRSTIDTGPGDEGHPTINPNAQLSASKFVDPNGMVGSGGVAYAIYQPPLEKRCVNRPMRFSEYGMLGGQVETYNPVRGSAMMAWGFDVLSVGNLKYNTGTAVNGLAAGHIGTNGDDEKYSKNFGGMVICYPRETCQSGIFNVLSVPLYLHASEDRVACLLKEIATAGGVDKVRDRVSKAIQFRLAMYTSTSLPLTNTSGSGSAGSLDNATMCGRQWVSVRAVNPKGFPYRILEEQREYSIPFVPGGSYATSYGITTETESEGGPSIKLTPVDEWIFDEFDIVTVDGCNPAVMACGLNNDLSYTTEQATIVLVMSADSYPDEFLCHPETTYVSAPSAQLWVQQD